MPARLKNMIFLAICVVWLLPCHTFADGGPASGQPWRVPGLGMNFVCVAPGSFMMGSNDGEDSEKPIHRVTIGKEYWIGRCEVTQNEYQRIMGSNPSYVKGINNPVEFVSWNDAVSFCQKLTDRERNAGRLPSGYEYRLPTEAEWEFAARGGTVSRGYKYSGGDNIDSVAWYIGNSGKAAHEVGTKSPNELGICDMSGNVWEWCLDDWHDNYNGAPSDGSRWSSGTLARVIRGGAWYCSPRYFLVAFRGSYLTGCTYYYLGFRVVMGSISK